MFDWVLNTSLKYFAKFRGTYLCLSPFFDKVAGLKPTDLSEKALQHNKFPMNFAKFLEQLFYRLALVTAI